MQWHVASRNIGNKLLFLQQLYDNSIYQQWNLSLNIVEQSELFWLEICIAFICKSAKLNIIRPWNIDQAAVFDKVIWWSLNMLLIIQVLLTLAATVKWLQILTQTILPSPASELIIVTKLYTGELAIFLLKTLIAALNWSVCHAESCLHLARGFRKGVCLWLWRKRLLRSCET